MKTTYDAVNEFKGEWPYGVFNTIVFGKHRQGWSDFYKDNSTTLANCNWYAICTDDEFNDLVSQMETNFGECYDTNVSKYKIAYKELLTKKPQPTLTYTQAMADNGELPSVGMECVGTSSRGPVMTSWEKGSIIFTSPTYTIFKTSNGIEFCCNHLVGQDFKYKPLTPPIELIDGKAYQFTHQSCRGLGFYNERLDEFSSLNHKIDIRNCTNIQPLTVEVK